MKCCNCNQEIPLGSKPRIVKYCVTCAPLVAKEYIRKYQKTRDEAARAKRLASFESLSNQINQLPATALAYIAGLFDGEGSVSIIKTKPDKDGSAPLYSLHITISNNCTEVLRFVKDTLQIGAVCLSRGNNYTWHASNRGAAIVLKCLSPYLHIKHRQAVTGVTFQLTINGEYHGYLNRLSKQQIEEREQFRQTMLGLNHFYRATPCSDRVSGISPSLAPNAPHL